MRTQIRIYPLIHINGNASNEAFDGKVKGDTRRATFPEILQHEAERVYYERPD